MGKSRADNAIADVVMANCRDLNCAESPESQVTSYIGIGSNLQDPQKQCHLAVRHLSALPDSHLSNVSSLYISDPLGPRDQPRYLNAVAELVTQLKPHDLLDCLQAIEQKLGRVRSRRWGERTVDLDLLLYGECCIESERLSVPHPGISERAFVLLPLLEIAPAIDLPGLGLASDFLKTAQQFDIARYAAAPQSQGGPIET